MSVTTKTTAVKTSANTTVRTDFAATTNTTTTTISQHLLKRLKEVGIDTIFGVPGDFNLSLMELIEEDKEIIWGHNANELNASYAADGYARVKGIGALVTTSGVGELSAMNGIAGAYSERVPVIHIVASALLQHQKEGALIHHSLGNGDFSAFAEMAGKVTCAYTTLNKCNPLEEIDRVIEQSFIQKLPGYINIPMDLINFNIEEISTPLNLNTPGCSRVVEYTALSNITKEILKASYPVIIVDFLVDRFQAVEKAQDFVKSTGFPTFITPMAKGIIRESYHNYIGPYSGSHSSPEVLREIEKADLVIEIGPLKCEFNTGLFTTKLGDKKIISINPNNTIALNTTYDKLGMHQLLPRLAERLPKHKTVFDFSRVAAASEVERKSEITQEYFWNKFKSIVEPNSVAVLESGSCMFKYQNLESSENVKYIFQLNWSSIGYTVGAALGAALADRKRRVYLFVGDGAFQMGAQELSVYLYHGITPVIFIINNDGYLVEKKICGAFSDYNNFQMWEYSKSLTYFGGHLERNTVSEKHAKIGLEAKVTTRAGLEKALIQVQEDKDKIHLLEVVTPQFDVTKELDSLVKNMR